MFSNFARKISLMALVLIVLLLSLLGDTHLATTRGKARFQFTLQEQVLELLYTICLTSDWRISVVLGLLLEVPLDVLNHQVLPCQLVVVWKVVHQPASGRT